MSNFEIINFLSKYIVKTILTRDINIIKIIKNYISYSMFSDKIDI